MTERIEEFDEEIIANPLVFEQNRLNAHSDVVLYASEEERDNGITSLRKCLNGIWKFAYSPNSVTACEDFYKKGYDITGWDDIPVPAHIQLEGYDKPHYTNTSYPWDGREWIVPGEIPKDFNPIASYIKEFEIPEDWKGADVRISFQGVESGFACWLNGHYVGYSEDSFDPADFDLTPFLEDGANRLAVKVWKWTASSWCEDQDFFRFSGIFRDVFIYPVKRIHLENIKINARVDNVEEKRGELSLELACSEAGKAGIRLFDAKCGIMQPSKELCSRNILVDRDVDINDGKLAVFYEKMTDLKLWSAEMPNLYVLEIKLYDSYGKLTELVTQFVGFRKFELKDGLMLLNGERIVFKGVNRHEFSSKSGRVVTFDEIVTDVTIMKRNNINAIRTSHYPNNSHVYDDGHWMPGIYGLCDVFGLYMIAENNLESHGTMEAFERGYADREYLVPDSKEEWLPMLLDRVCSCYERDKNHPSILIWSVGNESCGGSVPYKMAKLFREKDPERLVHYEGVFHDRTYPETSDMESQMYTKVADIECFLDKNSEKPFICCEYTHAMGNSCGGMQLYTELAYSNPRYQGGFIWDFADQSLVKRDRYGDIFYAYGGDFGDRPTDGEFSGNGIVYGDREESPKMQAVKYNYQNMLVEFDGENIHIENRNLFTGTEKYICRVIAVSDGVKALEEEIITSVAPLERSVCRLPEVILDYVKKETANAEVTLTVVFDLKEDTLWAPAGYEVAFGQKVYKKRCTKYSCEKPVKYIRGNNNIGVIGEDFRVLFGRMSDGMISYVYKDREMLKDVPRPNFWRAPVSNDDGNMMVSRCSQWKIASLYASTRQNSRFEDTLPEIKLLENSVVAIYNFGLSTTPHSEVKVTYEVFGDGTVEMKMEYEPVPGLPDMPEFGILFKMDADYDNLKWYGLGPEETYADRLSGAKLGIYDKKVADNMAAYLVPQECGNKYGVRWAQVTDAEGAGLIFEGDELSFSALPYTPHELENAKHAYELPPVHNTIVRVAKAQLGVGGDDSWGAPVLSPYHIDVSGKVEFGFRFRGIG